MSEEFNGREQPPRTPFTPLYTAELSRDANGNLLYRDAHILIRFLPRIPTTGIHLFIFPEYQFALRPVVNSTSSASAPIPIDPALVPFPGGADADLRHGPTIANAIGLKRAEKVGGSRRKGKERTDPKGKKRQRASSGSDNDSEPVAKRGRPQGSANYHKFGPVPSLKGT
ncbi:hypothetical protein B0H13DRAFT_2386855 [Mycena leptocephala]|nr:hypothetical protein B0H13DRAFT_2386855 [Mycena leptocephala]